jgi:hypothetical protein
VADKQDSFHSAKLRKTFDYSANFLRFITFFCPDEKNRRKNLQIKRKVCTFAADLLQNRTKKHETDSKCMVVA